MRIERQILATCRRRGDGLEIRDIVRTAQLPAADSQAAYQTGLLTCSDLLHLYPDAEFLSENLDKLTEIHTTVRYVIENGLGAVPLEFHVADFHIQTEFHSYLTGTDHRFLLTRNSLLPFFDVEGLCLPVDFLEFRIFRVNAPALHLLADYRTLECNDTQVVTALRLNDDQIAHLDALA